MAKPKAQDVNLMRRDDYEQWITSVPSGICVFCHPNKYPQKILKEAKNWLWIAALAPYWPYHTMIIPKKHFIDVDELSHKQFQEMMDLYSFARKKFRAAQLHFNDGEPVYQYIFMWRIRDTGFQDYINIKKPHHLHLHLVPDRESMLDPAMDPDAHLAVLDYLKDR